MGDGEGALRRIWVRKPFVVFGLRELGFSGSYLHAGCFRRKTFAQGDVVFSFPSMQLIVLPLPILPF